MKLGIIYPGKYSSRDAWTIQRAQSARTADQRVTQAAVIEYTSRPPPTKGSGPFAAHSQMHSCISHYCHNGYGRKIDDNAHQSLSYDVALRQPKHEGSTQPRRKYCKLNCRRDSNQVTSSGIVGTRQSRCRSLRKTPGEGRRQRKILAERGGFEPPVELLTLRRFSKPLLSTTQPPLRRGSGRSSNCMLAYSFRGPSRGEIVSDTVKLRVWSSIQFSCGACPYVPFC